MAILGSSNNDNLDGTALEDEILGFEGDDTLRGLAGNDTLIGGSGDDALDGGEGNDTLIDTEGTNTLDGGAGNDTIIGGSGADFVDGGSGDDVIVTDAGNDVINAGAGDDTIVAGDGNDTIESGSGSDVIIGGAGDDQIAGGEGNDTIIDFAGTNALSGGDGNDTIIAGSGADTIDGGSGDDTIIADDGNDTIDGGAGDDVIVAGAGDDTVDGGAGNDVIVGGAGNDTLRGGAGNDQIIGDGGDDIIFAGEGIDSVLAGDGADQVSVDLGDTVLAGDGDDTVTLSLTGSATAETWLAGDGGHDTLEILGSTEQLSALAAELAAFQAHIAGGHANELFKFTSLNLKVVGFEALKGASSGGGSGGGTGGGGGGGGSPNADPVAGDDAATTNQNAAVTIAVLGNDSDPDGDALTVTTASAANGSVTVNSDNTITYTPNSGFSGGDTITYAISDGNGGTAQATVSVTVIDNSGGGGGGGGTGAGAPPVIALPPAGTIPTTTLEDNSVVISGISVDLPGVTDGVVNTSVSTPNGAVALTITNGLTFSDADGSDGTIRFSGTESAINTALANSILFTPALNYNGPASVTVAFDDGGNNPSGVVQSVSTVVPITVTPVNDPPAIAGALSGNVIEDSVLTASGALSANDPDAGTDFVWSIVGGTPTSNANYRFLVDSFRVIKNGSVIFVDPFNDGIVPPDTSENSGTSNSEFVVSGVVTETGGRLVLDAAGATGSVGAGTDVSFVAHQLMLGTNIDPANLTNGLKIDDDLTIEATFDLSSLPDSPNEAFGIRFNDRLITSTATTPAQGGDDSLEIRVRFTPGGQLVVDMLDRSFVDDTAVSLQRIPLNAPAGADQITLRLTHAAANPGVVSGSFDFLAGGGVVSTQSFTATGQIFNGENWTRAQIIAFAPGISDASLAGTYGGLTLNQAGEWTYTLNNDAQVVQALNASDTVTDSFSVRVLDTDGAFDIQTLTINVTGANDLLVA